MNRLEYLTAFEKALKSMRVRDCDDILAEYSEHFDLKTADGFSEEEISARLGLPEDIAVQFKEISPGKGGKTGQKIVAAIGFFFLDFCLAIPIFISLYAWIFSFAASAFAFAISALTMITGLDRIGPWSDYVNVGFAMPYLCAIFIGVALLALAVLAAMGTEYCRLYINRLLKLYINWHRMVLGGVVQKKPPQPLHPVIGARKRRIMRSLVLVSVLVFALFSIVGFASMVIVSGSLEPWHIWDWFV